MQEGLLFGPSSMSPGIFIFIFALMALRSAPKINASTVSGVGQRQTSMSGAVGNNASQVHEFCEDEMFAAKCPDDSAVVVTSALYGRMRRGRCVALDVGCAADVRAHLDRACSGRPSCRLPVTDLLHDGKKPCPKDFRSYLEASFECVPVLQPSDSACSRRRQNDDTASMTSSADAAAAAAAAGTTRRVVGHVSSYVTSRSGCGSVDTPWTIRAASGQRINLTLVDFSASPTTSSGSAAGGSSSSAATGTVCLVYAVIRDVGASYGAAGLAAATAMTRTVCGGRGVREEHVLLSATDAVEVRMIGKRRKEGEELENFLVAFQFVGCADPALPAGTTLKRDEREAIVGCERTEAGSRPPQWRLTCVTDDVTGESSWNGLSDVTIDCPSDRQASIFAVQDRTSSGGPLLFKGLSVVILASVAGVVGLLILTVGLIILARKRRNYIRQTARQYAGSADGGGPQNVRFDSLVGSSVVAANNKLGPPPPPSAEYRRKLLEAPPGVYNETFQQQLLGRGYTVTTTTCDGRPLPPPFGSCNPGSAAGFDPRLQDHGARRTSQQQQQQYGCHFPEHEHIYESPTFERRRDAMPAAPPSMQIQPPLPPPLQQRCSSVPTETVIAGSCAQSTATDSCCS